MSFSILSKISAQQNLFNIPSGVITPKKEFFFQQQINAYDLNQWAAKSHFVLGVGRGWEVGFNITDINIDLRRENTIREVVFVNSNDRSFPFKPSLLFTVQKIFALHEKWQANIGTQMGFNSVAPLAQTHFSYFHYGLLKWAPKHHTAITAGPYIANTNIVGPYSNLGNANT